MGTTKTKIKRNIAVGTYEDMIHVRKGDILQMKEGQRLQVPGGYIETMTVDPIFARELLQNKHPNQRLVRHRHVENLAAAMTENRWHSTLDPIRLDNDLRVIDGQHRLLALIKSNTTQRFLVAILTDPAAFYAIDQNAPRSLNDIRATLGKKPVHRTIAGAILLEHRQFSYRSHGLSKEDVDAIFDKFPFMNEAKELTNIGKKAKIVGVGSLGAAIAALRVNTPEAMKFFGAVFAMRSVIEDREVPQAHMLYMFLHTTREQGAGRTTGEHYIRESAWKSLRAWNAWRDGEKITRLIYDGPTAKFPKARR